MTIDTIRAVPGGLMLRINGFVGAMNMYVKINRNVCDHQLPVCERCLGKFLKNPMGYERQCFEEVRDDGSDILTIDLHTGKDDIRLELNEEQRLLIGGEGWSEFVQIAVPMYRVTTEEPH